MKKLLVLLTVALIASCAKTEIKPTSEIDPVSIEKSFKEVSGTVYLITKENESIVSGQNYATTETEIRTIAETMLSDYIQIKYIKIDYETMIIDCSVLYESGWLSIPLKLYEFELVN